MWHDSHHKKGLERVKRSDWVFFLHVLTFNTFRIEMWRLIRANWTIWIRGSKLAADRILFFFVPCDFEIEKIANDALCEREKKEMKTRNTNHPIYNDTVMRRTFTKWTLGNKASKRIISLLCTKSLQSCDGNIILMIAVSIHTIAITNTSLFKRMTLFSFIIT